MLQNDGPTAEQIRGAIAARIDRTLALEELSWRLHSFIEDLWGPLPEGWSTEMAELGVKLSRGDFNEGESGGSAWESGRAQILGRLSPEERWLVGLSERLWDHAFDRGRESIRAVAIESFLQATLEYITEIPDVPPLKPRAAPDPARVLEHTDAGDDTGVTKPAWSRRVP
jgi:hypothetical protein